ncbi:MAG: Hsp20/alpha crystallin family protein [Gemmataceae bacterium]
MTKYQRTFRVTNTIAADKIQAQMEQGVLTLHLPKIEALQSRRILVNGA